MNIHEYCRERNQVQYADFMNHLRSCYLIFIGETDHFSGQQEDNEQYLLEQLSEKKLLNVITEDLSPPHYQAKREMLSRFSKEDLVYLPPDHQGMSQEIRLSIQPHLTTVVLLGSKHLSGPFSVDALVKMKCRLPTTTVFFDDNLEGKIPSAGIYRKETPANKDYIVAGNLFEIACSHIIS